MPICQVLYRVFNTKTTFASGRDNNESYSQAMPTFDSKSSTGSVHHHQQQQQQQWPAALL
ncbi:hypothetical protein ZHAS_00016836 [Anopheles sinensis]|uniref:Uncharacterized protein n=1 Tax=Anopheles sinensis TaxID=74873 RepID=A0A084WE83_ANOSI|nr:hypothetical protein ZHAS_00016836 [Anopheles sinensis]